MARSTKQAKQKKVRVVSSQVMYRGPVFYVTSDRVQEPGGIEVQRDVVRHTGSVVVMAVDQSRGEPRVLLERQYRHAVQDYLWELPAGRIDSGEDELAAAKRELLEETGYRAAQWKRVLFFFDSPGFLDETMAIYLATGLKRGKPTPEEDEVIRKRKFPLSQMLSMIQKGVLRDGKTIAGVLWLEVFGRGSRTKRA